MTKEKCIKICIYKKYTKYPKGKIVVDSYFSIHELPDVISALILYVKN